MFDINECDSEMKATITAFSERSKKYKNRKSIGYFKKYHNRQLWLKNASYSIIEYQ